LKPSVLVKLFKNEPDRHFRRLGQIVNVLTLSEVSSV